MRNLEQEIKIQLDEREYNILANLTDKQPQLQVNNYFTMKNFDENVMVRVREKNGVFLLCCKQRLQQTQGITVCDERECEISADFAKSLFSRGLKAHEINDMLKTNFEEDMQYVGKMETYRTAFQLEEWNLELDKSQYLGKCDFELECESPNIQQLYKLENYLSYVYGIVIRYSVSKSQRFFEALNGKI